MASHKRKAMICFLFCRDKGKRQMMQMMFTPAWAKKRFQNLLYPQKWKKYKAFDYVNELSALY